jgi:hypothetical protein
VGLAIGDRGSAERQTKPVTTLDCAPADSLLAGPEPSLLFSPYYPFVAFRIAIKISTTRSDIGFSRNLRAHMDVPEAPFPNQSMAAYSVFTRDREPAESARLDLQEPAVLTYRRESPSAVEHPLEDLENGGDLDNGSSGEIVLRLPDLASSQPMALRLLNMPQLFWVAIVLGALLASV